MRLIRVCPPVAPRHHPGRPGAALRGPGPRRPAPDPCRPLSPEELNRRACPARARSAAVGTRRPHALPERPGRERAGGLPRPARRDGRDAATPGTGEVPGRQPGAAREPGGTFPERRGDPVLEGTELSLGDLRVGRALHRTPWPPGAWRRTWERLAKEPGFLVARESIREVQVAPDTPADPLRVAARTTRRRSGSASCRPRTESASRRSSAGSSPLASVPAGRSPPRAAPPGPRPHG